MGKRHGSKYGWTERRKIAVMAAAQASKSGFEL
jgi:hypothetical protein